MAPPKAIPRLVVVHACHALALALTLAACAGAGPPRAETPSPSAASTPPEAAEAAPAPGQAKTPSGTMTAGPSQPAGNDMIWNGNFAGESLRPWSLMFDSPRNGKRAAGSADGELCVQIDSAGTHPYDVILRQRGLALAAGHHYQMRLRVHSTKPTRVRPRLSKVGGTNAELWAAVVGADVAPQSYAGTFEGPVDEENVELAIELGGELAGQAPLTVCLADVELRDPAFEVPIERKAARVAPRVRVNQVGYLPGLAKIATVATAAPEPLEWQLVDARDKVRASGKTRPFGEDRAAGERVHQIDFSSFKTAGKGYKIRVGKEESAAFDIGPDVYRRLKYDALAFFYLQRSGIDIKMPYAGSRAYERPAGHVADKSVPCAPEAKCSYSLDVSGGWYDAGDHGKYVVNGGISVWLLQNQYETLERMGGTARDFGDGKMKIPEAKNGRPDLLDEARWGLDLLLRMQVPAGQPMAGMVHHKIHGEKWSAIPTMPDQDGIKRYLRPVSTAATLNLAAVAAQGARLWQKLDPAFSARCLTAAEAAFAAAKKNPAVRAEPMVQGGGAYGDGDTDDELYWAAGELFVTTGKPAYKDELVRSRFHTPKPGVVASVAGNVGWDHVAPLGKITLAVVPNALGEAAVAEQRRQLVAAADHFLATIGKHGYRVPIDSDTSYIWGSNAGVLDPAIVLGAAYRFTKDPKYANGVVDCMDYILGRNPLAQSYVAGHGTYAMKNPHHRVWAHQKDARLPEAPPGAVSGGPNSMMQDPYIRKMGKSGCPPETCYVDNIESYSTNEVAINWNAALAWDVAFLDDVGNGS
jgi:endoglucanase